MTRPCVVITAPTVRGALAAGRPALLKGADLVEIRLDHLRDLSVAGIERLSEALGRKGIATFRSPRQGGKKRPGRLRMLYLAARAGFGFLDVEVVTDRRDLGALREAARPSRTQLIASRATP